MVDKQYRFTRASRKHRIGREHVRHVLANVIPASRASPLGDVTEYVWIGPDVDLDEDDVRTPDGQRLTNERVAELAEDAVAAVRTGRPSLTGGDAHSPHVSFRVPEQLGRRAAERAEQEGKSVSQLGREALEQYLSET